MDMASMDPAMAAANMSTMSAIFMQSSTTPLYSAMWTPTSMAGYAGTCIFCIIIAAIFRFLLASQAVLEQRFLDRENNRRQVVVRGKPTEAQQIEQSDAAKPAVLITETGVQESVKVVQSHVRPTHPWRFSVDLPRALLATLTAGVGYLTMLAVMTMNVGYFMSVLAGTLVGELAFGRMTFIKR